MAAERKRWLLSRVWRRVRPPRRLKITREGRYFIFITIAIGLAAINTGNNLLYLLLGWLLSAIIGSGAMSDMSLRGLLVKRKPPPRVFANRPFLMEISVENLKGALSSYSVEIEDLVDGKPLDKRCYFLKVPPGRTQRTSYRHTFRRRGVQRFDGVRLGSKYPFGLFRKTRDVHEPGELLVYPEVFPVALPSPRSRYTGETVNNRIGRQGEFFGLREYRDGDDRRDIHWRSTARAGKLMVREYEQEAQQRATILIDNGLPADADDDADEALEQAISLAASLASTYITMGYQLRLLARGAALPFSGGALQLERVLRTLALLPTVDPATPFAGRTEPQLDNVLIVPRGVLTGEAPQGITHVLEAR